MSNSQEITKAVREHYGFTLYPLGGKIRFYHRLFYNYILGS